MTGGVWMAVSGTRPPWAPTKPLITASLGDDGWTEIGTAKDGPAFPPLEPAHDLGPAPFLTTRHFSVTIDVTLAEQHLRWLRRLIARDYRAERSAMHAAYRQRQIARRRRRRRG